MKIKTQYPKRLRYLLRGRIESALQERLEHAAALEQARQFRAALQLIEQQGGSNEVQTVVRVVEDAGRGSERDDQTGVDAAPAGARDL